MYGDYILCAKLGAKNIDTVSILNKSSQMVSAKSLKIGSLYKKKDQWNPKLIYPQKFEHHLQKLKYCFSIYRMRKSNL